MGFQDWLSESSKCFPQQDQKVSSETISNHIELFRIVWFTVLAPAKKIWAFELKKLMFPKY